MKQWIVLPLVAVAALQETAFAKEVRASTSAHKPSVDARPAVSRPHRTAHKKSAARPRTMVQRELLRPQPERYRFNEPADLIELVPVLRDINRMIPRQFSLAEHEFRLDPRQMIIEHQLMDLRARAEPKTSVITFSYYSAMGSRLSTRLDVPLFYSSVLGFSNWTRYPLGNYTMTINRDNPFEEQGAVYIRALTRF